MATCQTSRWVSTAPYIKLTVTQQSSNETQAVLAWTLQYIASSAASVSSARSYTVKINGSTVKSGTYSINGKTGTNTIASGTVTITKGTSAKSIAFSCSMAFNLTWSGTYGGTKSASGSISVAAKTSYTVSYNANGGSGAPSSQTKWHGTALTLSSTKPTRTGYTFKGWATSASGSVAYAAGGSYTANAAVTLYAVWQAVTYTISYNANGGSGAPSSQTKTYGTALTLSSTKPTRTNYNFKGWATSASGGVAYAAGGSYTANEAVTLYAVWELAYVYPTITGLSVARCDSDGTANNFGTYARVAFSWECSQLAGSNNVSSIKIEWKTQAATTWGNSTTVSASGTSGTVSQVIGSGALSIESIYNVRVTVKDSKDGSTVSLQTIPTAAFIIDFLAGGTGIAIGKAATVENALDVYKQTIIRGSEDASGTAAGGQLIVGDPDGYHLAFDNNEIMAKSNATTPYNLSINYDGGDIGLGNSSSTTTIKGPAAFNGHLTLANAKYQQCKKADGTSRIVLGMNASNELLLGYGGYSSSDANTGLYGNSIWIFSRQNYITHNSEAINQRKVLYNNSTGTYGTVTLSETAANFTMIEILAGWSDVWGQSVSVYSPNGKTVDISMVVPAANSTFGRTRCAISGTSITQSNNAKIGETGTSLISNAVYIRTVIGYR